jgi:hypothetical protein
MAFMSHLIRELCARNKQCQHTRPKDWCKLQTGLHRYQQTVRNKKATSVQAQYTLSCKQAANPREFVPLGDRHYERCTSNNGSRRRAQATDDEQPEQSRVSATTAQPRWVLSSLVLDQYRGSENGTTRHQLSKQHRWVLELRQTTWYRPTESNAANGDEEASLWHPCISKLEHSLPTKATGQQHRCI